MRHRRPVRSLPLLFTSRWFTVGVLIASVGGVLHIAALGLARRSTTRQLAGSTRPGPTRLPNQGTVKDRGATWQVSSFPSRAPAGPVRVYVLVG
jgi:hypothetical protein